MGRRNEMKLRRWVARRKDDGMFLRVGEFTDDSEEGGVAVPYSKDIGDATFYRTKSDAVVPTNDQWEAIQVFISIEFVRKT
jgi:hypothetical protein